MNDQPPAQALPPRRISTEALRARKGDRADFAARPRTPIAMVLDGVHGPYNQGALFRLCDGLMLEWLHVCGATLTPWNRRFKKAARGTVDWVPYSVGEVSVDVVQAYRARGYQIVVAEQAIGSVPVWEARLATPMCVVLGAELDGVSEAVLALADVVVELPTLGMANSLNLSMSAAMVAISAYSAFATQAASTDPIFDPPRGDTPR